MKSYTVNESVTLKEFTDNTCAQASFCFRTLLKNRDIRVNGERVSKDMPLQKGDVVSYYLTPAQTEKTAYTVVYEDDNITVTDKESGVNAEAVFFALSEKGECYFIHRLDRNTEGLMIFARNRESEEALLKAFRERQVVKVYHALVCGVPKKKHAVEQAFLIKDEQRALVKVNAHRGDKIVTEYEVLEERGDTSLIKVTLHTGKTHQIRAHLAYLSHPVLGDRKYGNGALNQKYHATRQRLLAKELTLGCGGALAYLNGKTFVSQKNL